METVETRPLTTKQKNELLAEILVNLLIFMKKTEEVFVKYHLFSEEEEEREDGET